MTMILLLANSGGFTAERCDALASLGLEIRTLSGREEQHYEEDFSDVDAVVCYRFFCHNDIARFPRLKFIQLTSHGSDHMPLDYIRSHGITLCDARGTYGAPIAEFALSGVLQLYKAMPQFYRQQAAHVWQQNRRLRELTGKLVCIVGAGSIGTECALRFRAMGCRVTGLCRRPKPNAAFDDIRPVTELDAVLAESDIVILAMPLNEDSRAMFDARRFACMKPGAVLVNVSRGPAVDSQALADALISGQLSGALADVFETEPLTADSPLWDMENLILTPHNSFAGDHNMERLFDLIYTNTKNWITTNGGNTI